MPSVATPPPAQAGETVADGITRTLLRNEPGEKRVLIHIEAGRTYPHHAHAAPDEVFVVAGAYCDPGVEGGREFAAGSYLYYPPGTEHRASSPAGSGGCTILVWNAGSSIQLAEPGRYKIPARGCCAASKGLIPCLL